MLPYYAFSVIMFNTPCTVKLLFSFIKDFSMQYSC